MSNRRISKKTGREYDVRTIGLELNTYRKRQQWKLADDMQYIEKLKKQAKSADPKKAIQAQEALYYLSRFNQEYIKGSISSNDPNRIHQSLKMVRECYRTNERNQADTASILAPVSLNSFSGEDTETSDGEKVLNESREALQAKYGNYTEDLMILAIDTRRKKAVNS